MGMVKHKMMEVQEEGWQAFEDGVEREENPYTDTMWAATWKEAWENRSLDREADYFDSLALEEDYHRNPDLYIDYLGRH